MAAWTPNDARQAEIHRRLSVIGGAPASYFRDACALMDGTPPLDSATHLVGHLLRELDGTLRDVIRPLVPEGEWPVRDTSNPEANKGNHKKIIELCCDALGVPAKDPLRRAWYRYSKRLHGRAHRQAVGAPRPIDPRFREYWQEAQDVTYEVGGLFEANYIGALGVIDELAAGPPDTKRLWGSVPHSDVALDRFFSRAGLDWFEPLRNKGYFDNPPALAPNPDGTVSFARWPPAAFVRRLAAEDPDAVCSLASGLDTDNPEAHQVFVDAAIGMEPPVAASMVPDITRWLATQPTWGLPFKVRDLVVRLVQGGETDVGLELMKELLLAAERERDGHLVGQLCEDLIGAVFPAVGLAGVEFLADLLEQLVAKDAYEQEDHSGIWRPSIAQGRHGGTRDDLVTAVRDAADSVVSADGGSLSDVLALLESKPYSIFRRLALHLLARHLDAKLAEPRLIDEELFRNGTYDREYSELSVQTFGEISPEGQARILNWIKQPPGDADDDVQRNRFWQKRMLDRLGEIPAEWQETYDDLASDPEPQGEVLREGFVGPISPITEEELASMEVEAVVAKLRSWEPEGGFGAPSPEGLSRTVRQVIAADPEPFADAAPLFAEDVDPTYVRALIGGLTEACKAERPFAWRPVLEFCAEIIGRPREIEGRDPRSMDLDFGWQWSWRESVNLVSAGLSTDTVAISLEERDLVWQIISSHAEDPDPSPEREANSDWNPETLAINSIRGIAMRAVFNVAWWLRGFDGTTGFAPEITELLERHLDPEVDPSAAIRAVYGQCFPMADACDSEWAKAHSSAIFTADPLGTAAWNAYLRLSHAYTDPFRILSPRYIEAVDGLAEEEREEDPFLGAPGRALVRHIMDLYVMGAIDFGDDVGLLDRFYEVAAVKYRADAIETIGQAIDDENSLREGLETRLRGLFERRLAAVKEGGDPTELRGFSWWFRSAALDKAWLLTQLQVALQAGVTLEPDHLVVDRLADLAPEQPAECIGGLRLLIDSGVRDWFAVGSRDEIRIVVREGLAAGGEAAEEARRVVNVLVARGYIEFEDLLP